MQMFRKNSFLIGAALGAVMPLLAYILTHFTAWEWFFGNKPLSLYVIAGLINLLLLRYYYRNNMENNARGVMLVTFIGVLLLIFGKGITI